jgi:hypothetical protein
MEILRPVKERSPSHRDDHSTNCGPISDDGLEQIANGLSRQATVSLPVVEFSFERHGGTGPALGDQSAD